MGSKVKAETDTTPEHEEQFHPSKKRKMGSLVIEIEKTEMTDLVKQGVDVKTSDPNFSLSEPKRFIKALFAATVSEHVAIINSIVRKNSKFEVVKEKNKTREDPGCSILPNESNLEEDIEVMELIGAACIFQSDVLIRKYGKNCWIRAMRFREDNGMPKASFLRCDLEKIALQNQKEFETVRELESLIRKRQTCWDSQAFFVIRRILKKRGCFQNSYVMHHLFRMTLHQSEKRMPHQSFAISIYLFEIIGTKEFLDELVRNPVESRDVVHSILQEFFNTLKRKAWNEPNQPNPHPLNTFDVIKPTLLSFENLMTSLVFSFTYQLRLHDHDPNDQLKSDPYVTIKSKSEKLEEVSNLILRILELLMPIPKSETQEALLKNALATYIYFYELKRTNHKPNLLLKLCSTHEGHANQFKLIKLLLEAGANPNAVDQHHRSPLHLLANRELASLNNWDAPFYYTRAENFTSIVRVILDGTFHEDLVDLDGRSALECLKSLPQRYPNPELCQLMGNFLQGVRPLSCIAAKVVRGHNLSCECLPVTLQATVLLH